MKKRTISICAALAVMLASCGKSQEEVSAETTLPVKVAVTQLQTTTTTTTAPPEEVIELTPFEKTDVALSEIENNIDDTIDLSLVQVNGKWLSISAMTYVDFIETAGIKKCAWVTISNPDEKLYFIGNGYGIDKSENSNSIADPTSFDGTLMGIECQLKGVPVETIEDGEWNYTIKAVTSSLENTKDDYEISYYGGIKVGMTRKEVLEALGDKAVVKNEVTVATTTTTPTTTTTKAPTETLSAETTVPEESVPEVTTIPSGEPDTPASVESESSQTESAETPAEESESAGTTTKKKKKKTKKTETEAETKVTTASVSVIYYKDNSGEFICDEWGKPITSMMYIGEDGKEISAVESSAPETATEVPETTEPTETTTTVPPVDEFETNYSGDLYFKNTKNTLVVIIRKGIVEQIYLYKNGEVSK